jgi:hypothetical protein
MAHDTYWDPDRADLRDLVMRLEPEDALEIVKKLIRSPEENMAPMLGGLIRGYVARRDDEQRHAKGDSGCETL